MQNQDPMEQDPRLTGLFVAYRDACPDPEPRADFMPRLWQKIEAQRTESLSIFKRLAQVCVAATALVLVALTSMTGTTSSDNDVFDSNYTDVIAADQTKEAYAIIHPASVALVTLGDQN